MAHWFSVPAYSVSTVIRKHKIQVGTWRTSFQLAFKMFACEIHKEALATGSFFLKVITTKDVRIAYHLKAACLWLFLVLLLLFLASWDFTVYLNQSHRIHCAITNSSRMCHLLHCKCWCCDDAIGTHASLEHRLDNLPSVKNLHSYQQSKCQAPSKTTLLTPFTQIFHKSPTNGTGRWHSDGGQGDINYLRPLILLLMKLPDTLPRPMTARQPCLFHMIAT